jgi:DNA-binding PadR family transcriptional regulator
MLMVSDKVDFNTMKTMLKATDGNLASHLSALEKSEYVVVHKQFVGKKPNTSYSITQKGKKAFEEHLRSLESLIRRDTFRNLMAQG